MTILRAPRTVAIDGTYLTTVGFVAETLPSVRDTVRHAWKTVEVPYVPGVALTDDQPTVVAREFTITGILSGTTLATLLSNYRNLQFLVGREAHEVLIVDDTAKHINAVSQGITFQYLRRELGTDIARVSMSWLGLDGYWEDEADTTVSLTTSAAACALGTAPCFPRITINQSCVITLKDGTAATVATMTVTGVSGAQTAVIDMATREITHSVSGYAPQLRTAGRYFLLDPNDGWYPLAIWPTLQLSTGTGSVTYAKRYEA